MLKTIKNTMILLLSMLFLYACVIFSESIKISAAQSINVCLTLIIPSLFGAMAVSCLIINSKVYAVLLKPLGFIGNKLFHISAEEFVIFILSTFSGYPMGAKLLYQLYEQKKISQKRLNLLTMFCYSSGPAFIAGTVASKLYGNIQSGMLIFFSVTTANVIMGLFIGFVFLRKSPENNSLKIDTIKPCFNSEILIKSVRSAAEALLQVCIMIVLFAILFTMLNETGTISKLTALISNITGKDMCYISQCIATFFEISNISKFSSGNYIILSMLTALLSFGGLCVILQICAITKGKINTGQFLLFRVIEAILSAIVCKLSMPYFLKDVTVSVSSFDYTKTFEYSVVPSVALLIMTLLLLAEKEKKD